MTQLDERSSGLSGWTGLYVQILDLQSMLFDELAAALDVFPNEPNVSDALLALPNVVVEPHIASTTEETRRAIGALVFANVKAHFSGAPLPSPVT